MVLGMLGNSSIWMVPIEFCLNHEYGFRKSFFRVCADYLHHFTPKRKQRVVGGLHVDGVTSLDPGYNFSVTLYSNGYGLVVVRDAHPSYVNKTPVNTTTTFQTHLVVSEGMSTVTLKLEEISVEKLIVNAPVH